MGWVSCIGQCIICGRIFDFNPNLVPSVRVRNVREPVCKRCIDAANPKRIESGLAPIEILPGAYEPEEV